MIAALHCILSGARGFTGVPVEKFPEADLYDHLRAAANVHAIERAVSRNGYCVVAVWQAAFWRRRKAEGAATGAPTQRRANRTPARPA
jgi:hypothetical protein